MSVAVLITGGQRVSMSSTNQILARPWVSQLKKWASTHDGPGRKGEVGSARKSSFSEFRREPGTECPANRSIDGWAGWEAAWGEVKVEGAKALKKPGEEVTLEVEKRAGRPKALETVVSRYSGGVVGSLTGPEMPA